MTDQTTPAFSRRRALTGVAGLGVAAPLLAACSGGSDEKATDPNATATSTTSADAGSGSGGSSALAATSDIPEGGGTIFADAGVVVTQPSSGEFKAFSSTCTHSGCPVGSVSGGDIVCPCHGSKFSIADGSVVQGPASSPLPEVGISVKGGEISLT